MYKAIIIALIVLAPFFSAVAQNTGANTGNNQGQFAFANPLCPQSQPNCPGDLVSFLSKLLNFITYLAVPIIVLMLIYTGFKFVAAQGNADKLADARRTLMWTLVGAGIILGANAILMAIQGTVTQIRGATGT